MKYEIKVNIICKDGRRKNESELTDTVEFAKRGALECAKYIKAGKTRFTWVEMPNDYQMKKYYDKYEVIITEAETGRKIWQFVG